MPSPYRSVNDKYHVKMADSIGKVQRALAYHLDQAYATIIPFQRRQKKNTSMSMTELAIGLVAMLKKSSG